MYYVLIYKMFMFLNGMVFSFETLLGPLGDV